MILTKNFYQEVKPFELLLKSVAYNLTKSSVDSEDLLQETYYKACRSLNSYKEGTNLKAWMVTIMKNTFINNYRKSKKERETIQKTGDIKDYMLAENGYYTESGVRILLNDTLELAINSLKPDYKVLFVKYYEGYKYQELADMFDLPIGTVKSRIFLARKELVSCLNKDGVYHSNIAS